MIFAAVSFTQSACTFKTKEQLEKEKNENEWKKYSADLINHWIGRKMILPKLPIVFDDSVSLDYKNTYKTPLKMVAYIDGSCGVCISSLHEWKKFMNKLKKQQLKVDCMIYMYAEDRNDFQKEIFSKLKLNTPWIFDKNMKFVKANDLTDMRFQTALINSDDKVLMLGSIVQRPELEELYIDLISQKSK